MKHQLLINCLKEMVEQDGSDLYFSTGAPPAIKINGKLKQLAGDPLEAGETANIAYSIMDQDQQTQFNAKPEMNLALSEKGIGRFRVNIFKQRNEIALVIRNIKTVIPEPEYLGLPELLKPLVMKKSGLLLFVGATGTGKSTTLASIINHRNENSEGHIITIEDPIEFVHQHKKSIINQREVGLDTHSYEDALKNTLRQAPDVILIGEIRSQETMEQAIKFSETGHLCLSTLHANNANQALDRIINFFPEERRQQLLLDLSLNLQAIISQRLVPSTNGKRVAVFEILLATPFIKDLILRGEINEIKPAMEKSETIGMQTFDTALFNFYKNGIISIEEALKNSDSANNLRIKISLHNGKLEKDELQLNIGENHDGNEFNLNDDYHLKNGNMRV